MEIQTLNVQQLHSECTYIVDVKLHPMATNRTKGTATKSSERASSLSPMCPCTPSSPGLQLLSVQAPSMGGVSR